MSRVIEVIDAGTRIIEVVSTGSTVVQAMGGGGGGVSDHGALSGLGDDDHTQYLNQVRGDLRYEQLGAWAAGLAVHLADPDPHDQYLTAGEGNELYAALGHGHTSGQISDFAEAVDDRVGTLLQAGANITLTYNDAGNTLTITSTGGGGGSLAAFWATDYGVVQSATRFLAQRGVSTEGSHTIEQIIAAVLAGAGAVKGNVSALNPGLTDDSSAGYGIGSWWLNTSRMLLFMAQSVAPGAAVWVRMTDTDRPQYVADKWYTQRGMARLVTQAQLANTLYAHPIYIAERITVKALGARVATAAALSEGRFGIYTSSGGRPANLVAEIAAPVATTAGGDVSAGFVTNPVINPGIYWLASLFNGTPSLNSVSGADLSLPGLLGGDTPTNVVHNSTQVCGVSKAQAYGALPAVFGAATVLQTGNGGCPVVALQVQ